MKNTFEIIYLRSIKGRYSVFLSNDAGERVLVRFNGLLSKESGLFSNTFELQNFLSGKMIKTGNLNRGKVGM